MKATEVQQALLKEYGIRVEPEMSQYVLRRLNANAAPGRAAFAVMGGDARTGIPLRQLIDPEKLAAASPTLAP